MVISTYLYHKNQPNGCILRSIHAYIPYMDPVGKAVAYHFMQSFIVQWVQRIHHESYISAIHSPFEKVVDIFQHHTNQNHPQRKNNLKKHTNSVCFRPLNLFHKQILITTLHFQPKTNSSWSHLLVQLRGTGNLSLLWRDPTCSCSICMVSCQVWGETMRQPRYLIDSDVVSVHHREVGHI